MAANPATLDAVMELVETLTPLEKVRLVARVMSTLEHEFSTDEYAITRSLLGLWQGTIVSESEIDSARKEMWGNFPREDL